MMLNCYNAIFAGTITGMQMKTENKSTKKLE